MQPDFVHINGYANAAAGFAAPVVIVAHSCVPSWWRAVKGDLAGPEWDAYRARVRAGMEASACIVAPTAAHADAFVAEHGLPQPLLIHNGRDAGRFAPGAKSRYAFAAGRFWDEAKNLSVLAEVARRGVRIRIAGEGAEGCFEALGPLQPVEIAAEMASAAVFVAPPLYEPFGLAVLEAAHSGCALVLADILTLRELWDGVATFVDPRNPAAIADAVDGLLADPAAAAIQARLLAAVPPATALLRWPAPTPASTTPSPVGGIAPKCWQPNEDRISRPCRGLLLEQRQRPFPARRRHSPAGARPRRRHPRAGRRLEPRRTCATTPATWCSRHSTGPFRPSGRSSTGSTSTRSTVSPAMRRTSSWCTSGTNLRWSTPRRHPRWRRDRSCSSSTTRTTAPCRRPRSSPASTFPATTASSPSARVIAEIYEQRGWGNRVWTWHEAADTRVFHPSTREKTGDLVWIGNWGDDERSDELTEFLLEPAWRLGLAATVYGVRYPERRSPRSPPAASATAAGSPTRGAGGVRPPPRHGTRPAPPLCADAARHPDHPRLRGAGLRHPAGQRAVAGRGGAVPGGRLPHRPRWRGDGSSQLRAVLSDPDLAASIIETGLATIAERSHLRPSRRRTPRPSTTRSQRRPLPKRPCHELRLLRLQPRLRLLERRRHLLSRAA